VILSLVAIGAMTLTLALVLAWPLFDAGSLKWRETRALSVYRDQLKEVAQDAERGILDEAQAQTLNSEIERRILALADEPASTPSKTSAVILVIAMAVGLPIAALSLYFWEGRPDLLARPATSFQTALPMPLPGASKP
jgi:cytochrome c-type biogenesis protein CcmH